MAGENTVEKVRQANDIVDVIGEYFPLHKAGSNYKALCPFHQEKTPSFVVSPDKQLFHCFGCGESGNLYNFVMKIEGLDFPEALRRMAERVNINISDTGDRHYRRNKQVKESILALNSRAAEFYHKVLFSVAGKKALTYLQKRGLNKKIIKEFKLGYAPGGSFLTRHALDNGVSSEELLKSGLSDKGRSGTFRDKFAERVIFPIHDERGQVRGFGGRVMDSSRQPKYLNTAQTPVFEKKQIIYGLYQGKETIREKKRIILLEGYMDVISAHQHGIKEAVAALGTAITRDHIYKIKHWVDDVVLSLDCDDSGFQAAEKGVDLLADSQISSRVCILPQGNDPEDIIRENPAEFSEYIKKSQDGMEWRIHRSIEKAGGKDTPEKKAAAVKDLVSVLKKIKNAVKREEVRKAIAEELNISERAVMQVMGKSERDLSLFKEKLEFNRLSREEKIYRELLHIALKHGHLNENLKEALKYDVDNMYAELFRRYISESGGDVQKALSSGEESKKILSKLSLMPLNDEDPQEYLNELMNALERLEQEKRYRVLSSEIRKLVVENNPQQLKEKNREFKKLARELKGCKNEASADIF